MCIAYQSGSKTKQIIKNRYPNEPQTVKRFNYVIENGKIHIANGTDVQVAGTLKINSQGYVKSIS